MKQNLWKYEDNELHTDIYKLIQKLIVLNVFKKISEMNSAILWIQSTLTFLLEIWIHHVMNIRQNNHQHFWWLQISHFNLHIEYLWDYFKQSTEFWFDHLYHWVCDNYFRAWLSLCCANITDTLKTDCGSSYQNSKLKREWNSMCWRSIEWHCDKWWNTWWMNSISWRCQEWHCDMISKQQYAWWRNCISWRCQKWWHLMIHKLLIVWES